MRTLSITLEDHDGKRVHCSKKCLLVNELDALDDPAELLLMTVQDLVLSLDRSIKERAIASNVTPDTSDFGKPRLTKRTISKILQIPNDSEIEEPEGHFDNEVPEDCTDIGADFDTLEVKCPSPRARKQANEPSPAVVRAIARATESSPAPQVKAPEQNEVAAEFDDNTPHKLGKHRGTPLGKLKVSYIHWMWTNFVREQTETRLHRYILRRMKALKMEDPDLIWD